MKPKHQDIELNMTPMIDVVFNLLVFFMIVLDLSQKELETLALPDAICSVEDRGEERVTVNIVKAPDHEESGGAQIVVRGREYDLDGLGDLLFAAAARRRGSAAGPDGASEVPVLVRCDRDVPWRFVQHVLQTCARPPVRIYRIEFATAKLLAK